MGAQLNAYTSREQTVYYAQCLKPDVPKVLFFCFLIVHHYIISQIFISDILYHVIFIYINSMKLSVLFFSN
jgi:hypothetical protein